MKNPANRELSTQLYRFFEHHEDPPVAADLDANTAYFADAWEELNKIIEAHPGSQWAMMLCIGYYQALEAVWEERHKCSLAMNSQT